MLRCACLPGPNRAPKFTELSLEHRGTYQYINWLMLGRAGDGCADMEVLYVDHLGIRAVNGRLVCGSHQGTKSPRFSAEYDNGGEN